MFATATDLLTRFGAEELAQVATDDPAVDATLIQLTIEGGNRDSYTAEQIAAADAALATINEVLLDADEIVKGYVTVRYPTLSDPAPRILTVYAADIARFHLHDDQVSDEIANRNRDAMRALEKVSAGTLSLGVTPEPSTSDAPVISQPGERVFSHNTLADF